MIPKFRGISIADDSKGKMQYGYLIADGEQAFIINEVVEANEQYITIGSWCPVDQKTIGQSTGLKDKNGKEIFEGDIVEFEDEVWYTDGGFYENKDEAYDSVQTNNRVVIIYDGFEWDLDNFWKGTSDCSSAWMSIFEDHMQSFKYFLQNEASVIGNIYENPELLEATE